jgi:hypothetical protein
MFEHTTRRAVVRTRLQKQQTCENFLGQRALAAATLDSTGKLRICGAAARRAVVDAKTREHACFGIHVVILKVAYLSACVAISGLRTLNICGSNKPADHLH